MRKHSYRLPFLLWCFFLLWLTACSGVSSATPTPTLTPDTATSTPAPLQGAAATATCDEAVQRIQHNEIGLVQIYRQKTPIAYVPNSANSVVDIIIYPRSAHTDNPAEPYNPFLQVNVYPIDYPDKVCYPRLIDAVKQINAHLAKDQQVQLDMLFTVG
ncbi:MAG TPA: hypothetical protein VKY19_25500 [Ktedonosporobacter sp.]|jgi:hypothetical protein|nr:hypothetical protein [Ktedonosporobacter sp.]